MNESIKIKPKINFRNIKSSFIKKKVFSFLYNKRKLNMMMYNRELQKLFSIEIEDYELISEKYKIGKRNGKGKEYNYNGELKFEKEMEKERNIMIMVNYY